VNTQDAELQMTGLDPEEQARRAIRHVLVRIRDDSSVGYYLGQASQSFALLTEAYAALTGRDAAEVCRTYAPQHPKHPCSELAS
jgi:hypothetical protein